MKCKLVGLIIISFLVGTSTPSQPQSQQMGVSPPSQPSSHDTQQFAYQQELMQIQHQLMLQNQALNQLLIHAPEPSIDSATLGKYFQ